MSQFFDQSSRAIFYSRSSHTKVARKIFWHHEDCFPIRNWPTHFSLASIADCRESEAFDKLAKEDYEKKIFHKNHAD